jgi:hypothetical protein
LLVPIYSKGYLGAGCVKMQAAFGAWIGCGLPPAQALKLIVIGTLVGTVLLAVELAAIFSMVAKAHGNPRTDPHVFDQDLDKTTSASPSKGPKEFDALLVPTQLALSAGSICGVFVPLAAGWV